MDFDTLANYADIIAVPLAMIGIYYIVRQLKLALLESERDHQRRQNEMTLNAYNTVRGDLRDTIRRIRITLGLADMFSEFTQENLEQIMNDEVLRDDVAKMLGFVNKFAVGINHDVFNILLVNDLAGKLFIQTFHQFYPYIQRVREDYEGFYKDYENLVYKLKKIRYEKDNAPLLKDVELVKSGYEYYHFPKDFGKYLFNIFKT
ncbi:MAG: hypothetical protein DSZ07_00770 [Sulfurovum sp.]|nr:MAG: hypothetical protein DSZ07_00770 [Sulfurovum sp.]